MAVLLRLGRQGAAAGCLAGQPQVLLDLAERRHGQARPVHGRVGPWPAGVQQAAVLDEQQTLRHQRRDALEVRIKLLGVAIGVQHRGGAVLEGQAGMRLLRVGHEEAATGIFQQGRREARLCLDTEALAKQALGEARDVDVTQAAVEGPVVGEEHLLAGAGLDPVVEACGVAAQPACLQLRGLHLVPAGIAAAGQQRDGSQEHESTSQGTAALGRGGAAGRWVRLVRR